MMSTKETQKEMTNKLFEEFEQVQMWWELSEDDKSCVRYWLQEVHKLEGMCEMVELLGFEIPEEIRDYLISE